jgi:hypothetical protein
MGPWPSACIFKLLVSRRWPVKSAWMFVIHDRLAKAAARGGA